MADDRRKHRSRTRHKSSSNRLRRNLQSRQQDHRDPRGSNDVCTIPEENGGTIEYNVSHGSLYSDPDPGRINPTYIQSSFNMTSAPTTASPTASLSAYTGFPISLPAGSQAQVITEVTAYEPTSTNSDSRLPSGSSDYYSGSERPALRSTVAMSIDPWDGSYPTHPSSSDSYPNVAFTSGEAGSYTQSLAYTWTEDTSAPNHDRSTTPSPLSLEAPIYVNNVLEEDHMLDQGQNSYDNQGYRRGSADSNHRRPTRRLSMQNNYGSAVSLLPDPTIPGEEQAYSNEEDLRQGSIDGYVNNPSPWSTENLSHGGYNNNISSAYNDTEGSAHYDWGNEPN
ncbi:hypothetical protein F4776DRAFT_666333 [Hypoxylon sp. NC0597]|nr:hypothetical protein F4776DRAFT_666333 [Hypoxylon sp. NC0597]